MSGTLRADLALTPEIWLLISLVLGIALYFKPDRLLSLRNLDLLLLYALTPGTLILLSTPLEHHQLGYVLMLLGAGCWLVRCLIDLGLYRRPSLVPNINVFGLSCVTIGMLGLLVGESINLSVRDGKLRNPAELTEESPPGFPSQPIVDQVKLTVGSEVLGFPAPLSQQVEQSIEEILHSSPLPRPLKEQPLGVVISRIVAGVSHVAMVVVLIAIGRTHYRQPSIGLAMAGLYVLVPATRFAVVDSGQVAPALLVILAILLYRRTLVAAGLLGLAVAWMPALVGLIPLWTRFYRDRSWGRFLVLSLSIIGLAWLFLLTVNPAAQWLRDFGINDPIRVGLLPHLPEIPRDPDSLSLWATVEPSYRLPVWILGMSLVVSVSIWPGRKDFGQLIATSALVVITSQFWYLKHGGTLVITFLPLVILMMFRPTMHFGLSSLNPARTRVREPVSSVV